MGRRAKLAEELGDVLDRKVFPKAATQPPNLEEFRNMYGVEVTHAEALTLTYRMLVNIQLVKRASLGHMPAIADINNRIHGLPVQMVENLNVDVSYEQFLEQLPEPPKVIEMTLEDIL